MAYCRFLEGDVYAFKTVEPGGDRAYACCGCLLPGQAFYSATAEELFWHLVVHRLAGHEVPEDALAEIYEDAVKEQVQRVLALTLAVRAVLADA